MVKKVLIGIGVLILVLVSMAFLSIKINERQPAPQLVANFVDLEKIEKISKYRSCAGHVTVPQDERETKRNMKHYFWVKPQYNKTDTVEIYSPYEGYVSVLRNEPGLNLEGEIWIIPDRKIFSILPPSGIWSFSVQHINVRKDLRMGSRVKAGEPIGYAALSEKRGNSFDIVYGKMSIIPKTIDNWTAPFSDLDSIFNHMSNEVFVQYQKKGVTREKVIVSKEERDNNPCVYKDEGPYFEDDGNSSNWVVLK